MPARISGARGTVPCRERLPTGLEKEWRPRKRTRVMNRTFVLPAAVFCSFLFSCSAWSLDHGADFEQDTDGWSASPGSVLSRTATHRKDGAHSLEWTWTHPGASLSYAFTPRQTRRNRQLSTHVAFWAYNATPRTERLYLELYRGRTLLASCWFNQNYSGWRVLGMNTELLGIPPGTEFDKAVFRTDSPCGTLWLDAVNPSLLSSPVQPDDQQPWAARPELLKLPPEQTRYNSHDISLNRPHLPPFVSSGNISASARSDMQKLKEHYLPDRKYGGLPYRDFAILRENFSSLEIRETEGAVTGKPLALSDNGFHTLPGSIDFNREYLPLFRQLAAAIHREQGGNRKEAQAMYLLMCRHLLDQGFQEGNGNFGWIGNGYDYRHYSPAVFAHRGLLEQAGLLDMMAKSTAWLNMGHAMLDAQPYSSCDQFYNYSSHLPPAILMIPDEAERYQRLRAYKNYLDITIGTNDYPFGRDGTVHHHTGHHLSYGGYTPPALLRTQILPFRDTEFRISPETQEKLRAYVRACSFQIMHSTLAPNLYLRSGTPLSLSVAATALQMAQLGSPGRSGSVDREMAALYLAALDGADTPEAAQWRTMGITAARVEGHMNLNLAATAIHRRADWQAAAVGMLKHRRGLEIYGWTESNNYGRYSRNGTIFLTIGKEHGWRRSGWNWNHWPAGTNPVLDNHELFEGYALFSNNNDMAGGVALDGNGVWGNDFHGRDMTFKKSAFFFGNLMTVITTDIAPTRNMGKKAVTTLFQQSREAGSAAPLLNGRETAQADLDGSGAVFLRDVLGNHYYIHPGAPLRFRLQDQEWTYFNKQDLRDPHDNPCLDMRRKQFRETPLSANAARYRPTRGAFALAYLDHGTDPVRAACSYVVCISPTAEQAGAFAGTIASATPPVTILRKDSTAHAVYHHSTATTGYAVFAPCTDLPAPLKSMDRPGFILVRDLGDRYRIALATGDPAQNKEYRLEFRDRTQAILTPGYPLSTVVEIAKSRGASGALSPAP